MRQVRGVSAGLLVLLLAGNAARAEEAAPSPAGGGRISAGIGLGSEGLAGLAGLYRWKGRALFGVRFAGVTEVNLVGPQPSEETHDVSFLVGRTTRGPRGFATLAGGLGYGRSTRRGSRVVKLDTDCWIFCSDEYEAERKSGPVLALEARAALSTRHLGLGAAAFGHVGPRHTMAGLALTLELGDLR